MLATLYTSRTQNIYMGSAIQTTVKTNELSSIKPVYIHGFHNDVIICILKIDESTIHRIFVTSVVFMEAIFLCLNLKPDDGFLRYSMPKVFDKTG